MRKKDAEAALKLINEASARMNKRTKAYRLLMRARNFLVTPVTAKAINRFFKKIYKKETLERYMNAPNFLYMRIQKEGA